MLLCDGFDQSRLAVMAKELVRSIVERLNHRPKGIDPVDRCEINTSRMHNGLTKTLFMYAMVIEIQTRQTRGASKARVQTHEFLIFGPTAIMRLRSNSESTPKTGPSPRAGRREQKFASRSSLWSARCEGSSFNMAVTG